MIFTDDLPFGEEDEQPSEAVCKYCGAKDLEWVNIGMGRWRLYDGDKIHNCLIAAASPGDFKDLTVCKKIRYETKAAAAAVLSRLKADPSPRRRESSYYQCPRCHYWHLTSRQEATPDDFEDLTKP